MAQSQIDLVVKLTDIPEVRERLGEYDRLLQLADNYIKVHDGAVPSSEALHALAVDIGKRVVALRREQLAHSKAVSTKPFQLRRSKLGEKPSTRNPLDCQGVKLDAGRGKVAL
jgi:hypothetical protein